MVGFASTALILGKIRRIWYAMDDHNHSVLIVNDHYLTDHRVCLVDRRQQFALNKEAIY